MSRFTEPEAFLAFRRYLIHKGGLLCIYYDKNIDIFSDDEADQDLAIDFQDGEENPSYPNTEIEGEN